MVDNSIATTTTRTVVPVGSSTRMYMTGETDKYTPTRFNYLTKQEQLTPTIPPLIHQTVSTRHFQSNHFKNVEFTPNVAPHLYRLCAPSATTSQPLFYPHASGLSSAVQCPLVYQTEPVNMGATSTYIPPMNTPNYWYSHPTKPFQYTMNKGDFGKPLNGHYLMNPTNFQMDSKEPWNASMKSPLHTLRRPNFKAVARYYDEYMSFGSQVVPWIFGFLKSCCLFQPFLESNSLLENQTFHTSQFNLENVCVECGQVVGKRDLLCQSMVTKQPYTKMSSLYESEKVMCENSYQGYEGWDICVEKPTVTKKLSTPKPNLPIFDVAPPRCFKKPVAHSSCDKIQESKVTQNTCFEKDDKGRILLPTFS